VSITSYVTANAELLTVPLNVSLHLPHYFPTVELPVITRYNYTLNGELYADYI